MTLELSKIFVGGVPFDMDAAQLQEHFSEFGPVIHAKVVRDISTGASRGFGFVEFADAESATRAMTAMDGADLGGRTCNVSIARDRPGFGPRGREWNSEVPVVTRARPGVTGILAATFPADQPCFESEGIRDSRRPSGPDARRRRVERRRIPE